ncbi:MAG: hypothetical protein HZA17_14895 [Nitrospirae bacterium]|nr:hypothetical protein [Nitrospirota bacterium]
MTKKITKLFLILSMVTLLALPAQIFASVSNDQVLSQHIKEADGTSGQNTNSGSGVKTGHIQNGAITDAKISGIISGSKLGSHSHPGQDITSGTISVDKVSTYSQTKMVHKGAIDGVNTFNTISAALESITDNSAAIRYLVSVMPGIYEENVTGKSYVDILGQSREGVVIRAATGIVPQNNEMIKNITVDGYQGVGLSFLADSTNISIYDCDIKGPVFWLGGTSNIAIKNTMVDGYIIMYGPPTDANTVVLDGLYIKGGPMQLTLDPIITADTKALRITNSMVTGSGGIILMQGKLELQNLVVNHTTQFSDGALQIQAGQATCRFCSVSSNSRSIIGSEVNIDNSILIGAIVGNGGSIKIGSSKIDGTFDLWHVPGTSITIVNSHDGNYAPIPSGTYSY